MEDDTEDHQTQPTHFERSSPLQDAWLSTEGRAEEDSCESLAEGSEGDGDVTEESQGRSGGHSRYDF